MDKDIRQIYVAFDGKLVGSNKLKTHVCEVVYTMEEDIASFIIANCWFFGSTNDSWAFTLTGNDLKDQHLIFLSDDLLNQSSFQIHFTIAHEIGHVILKHTNSMLRRQSKEEIKKQEFEADAFAKRYVS